MASRIDALEATVAELAKTIQVMQDANAANILEPDGDNDDDVSRETPSDDDMNGTYLTFDDLYEN